MATSTDKINSRVLKTKGVLTISPDLENIKKTVYCLLFGNTNVKDFSDAELHTIVENLTFLILKMHFSVSAGKGIALPEKMDPKALNAAIERLVHEQTKKLEAEMENELKDLGISFD